MIESAYAEVSRTIINWILATNIYTGPNVFYIN